jgi:hypothetical protein
MPKFREHSGDITRELAAYGPERMNELMQKGTARLVSVANSTWQGQPAKTAMFWLVEEGTRSGVAADGKDERVDVLLEQRMEITFAPHMGYWPVHKKRMSLKGELWEESSVTAMGKFGSEGAAIFYPLATKQTAYEKQHRVTWLMTCVADSKSVRINQGVEESRFLLLPAVDEMLIDQESGAVLKKIGQAGAATQSKKPLEIVPAAHAGEDGEVYVMGQVERAGVFSISRRKITVKQLVYSAGISVEDAQKAEVKLIRREGPREERIFHMNFRKILEGDEADRFVQPNDVLSVEMHEANTQPATQAAAFSVAVQVQDEAGNAIPRAKVNYATFKGRMGDVRASNARTADDAGKARIDNLAQDGNYSVMAEAEGYARAEQRVKTPVAGEKEVAVTLVMKKASEEISGQVVDEEGKPCVGVAVNMNGPGNWGKTTTDAKGRFSFKVAAGWRGVVTVRDADKPQVVTAGRKDLKFVLVKKAD